MHIGHDALPFSDRFGSHALSADIIDICELSGKDKIDAGGMSKVFAMTVGSDRDPELVDTTRT